jgi:hypothetical protein
MRKYLMMLLLVSCAQTPPKKAATPATETPDDLVTVRTALVQARSSYLLGCVIAHKELNPKKNSYVHCMHKAQIHHQDLQNIMTQEVTEQTDEKP